MALSRHVGIQTNIDLGSGDSLNFVREASLGVLKRRNSGWLISKWKFWKYLRKCKFIFIVIPRYGKVSSAFLFNFP